MHGFKALLSALTGGLLGRPRRLAAERAPGISLEEAVEKARHSAPHVHSISKPVHPPFLVDELGEMKAVTADAGPWDVHVVLEGEPGHPTFYAPLRIRLRFKAGWPRVMPDVYVGGQLAFALVARNRAPPKVFWDTFLASQPTDSAASLEELLVQLRRFLLRPAAYLGLPEVTADSEGFSVEARRLHSWVRDAGRINAKRLDVIHKYRKQAVHSELFDELQPLKEEWFHPDAWTAMSALHAGDASAVRAVLKEHAAEEVFSFPLFTDAFCDKLLEEVFSFYKSGLPARRPNSMNNYGIILSDIGLEPFIDRLQEWLQPLGEELFQAPGSLWDGHHCFIVRYREGEDLGLDMHTDDSDVTFNICLGLEFEGAGLQFCGLVGEADHRKHHLTYQHRKGHCVVHLGRKRHGADDITSGERLNLILWNHSSEFRQSREYRNPSYAREAAAPDDVCLSYTHDRDFGAYKAYPAGREHFRGRGWCPPPAAEYPGFKQEFRFRSSGAGDAKL